MRNKLNFRLKINTKSSKIRKYVFVKTLIRALSIGINIIYIDETNFHL